MGRSPVRYAQSGEIRLAFRTLGDGPEDIVFVPGFVSNAGSLDSNPVLGPLLEGLERFARVVFFDKRGTGLSERAVGIADLENRMDDVRAVMDAAGVERAHLLGHSEGGPMSLLFAATYPERVASLCLVDSFARFVRGPDNPWMPSKDERNEMAHLAVEYWGTGLVLGSLIPGEERDDGTVQVLAGLEIQGASPLAVKQLLEMNNGIDVCATLPAITVPTLVVHDRGDQVVPFESGQFLADEISSARLVPTDFGGHISVRPGRPSWVDDYQEMVTGRPPEVVSDRVLATVLFTDIVQSTTVASRLGDREWRRLLDRHDEVVGQLVEDHSGKVVKTTGDGVLARFDGPGRAVRCAQRIGEQVLELGLRSRAGAHTGEVELRGADLGGIAVHIASRVADRAAAGEVLVSRTVKDLTVGSGLVFDDRGEHDLRGIAEPWRLYAARA